MEIRLNHRIRRLAGIGLPVAILLLLGAVFVPAGLAGAQSPQSPKETWRTYPVDMQVEWTQLRSSATAPVTANVEVTALGGYPVTGLVQICQDSRCYGHYQPLVDGKADLEAIVPFQAGGLISLQVAYWGGGFVAVPGHGITEYLTRPWRSQQVEARVSKYPTHVKAHLADPSVRADQHPVVTVSVDSDQPRAVQYVTQKRLTTEGRVPSAPASGVVVITHGQKKLAKQRIDGKPTRIELPAMKPGTYTLKVHYLGSTYQGSSVGEPLRLTVRK